MRSRQGSLEMSAMSGVSAMNASGGDQTGTIRSMRSETDTAESLVVVLSSANIKLEPLADLCSVVWHCMSCRVSFIICLSCLRLLFHFILFYFILSCFIHLYPFAVLQDHFHQLHLVWRGANWGHSAGGSSTQASDASGPQEIFDHWRPRFLPGSWSQTPVTCSRVRTDNPKHQLDRCKYYTLSEIINNIYIHFCWH